MNNILKITIIPAVAMLFASCTGELAVLSDFEAIPNWLKLAIGFGTFPIAIGAAVYARLTQRRYSLTKNPLDVLNMWMGILCSAMLLSPEKWAVAVSIAAFAVLVARYWSAIKEPVPVIVLTILTAGGFVNMFWLMLAGLSVFRQKPY
jgi:hypothetical protein